MKEIFQKLKTWQKIGLATILVIFLINVFTPDLTPEELKQVKIENKKRAYEDLMNARVDSAKLMSITITKKTLKDPDSFKIIDMEGGIIDKDKNGAVIQVFITYTATNSFGGRISNVKGFWFNENLKIVDVKEE
jgi:hypothetical protein